MTIKLVALDTATLEPSPEAWRALEEYGELAVYLRSSDAEILDRSRGASVLIVNKARITRQVLAQCKMPLLIAVTATGFDCVDMAAAREFGATVCNVPEYGSDSVAQLTFALILELCHHTSQHAAAVADGAWLRSPDFSFRVSPLVELSGKTLGLVGFGNIARRVARIGEAFGMHIGVHRRNDRLLPDGYAHWQLDELFANSDVVSLHCPLTQATAQLVNARRLSLMKTSSFIINTARGGLVREQDLAEALNCDRIAGAGLDVVACEPMTPDNPLLAAKNCVITPHLAWATAESRARLFEATLDNVRRFFAGQPANVVASGPRG